MTDRSTIRVFTPEGVVSAKGLTLTERSLVSSHWNAVRRYVEYGDDGPLVNLERSLGGPAMTVRVAGRALAFDLGVIERHAFRGDVRFESIYDEVV